MRNRNVVLLALMLLGSCKCNEDSTSIDPCTFTDTCPSDSPVVVAAASATLQSVPSGGAVPDPPAIQLLRDGQPFVNPLCLVTFSVTGGGGQLYSLTAPGGATSALVLMTTSVARVDRWVLGTATGQNAVRATVGCSGFYNVSYQSRDFVANGVTEQAGFITKVAGDNQSAEVGSPLIDPLRVRVDVRPGVPLPLASVAFRVASGGGNLNGPTTVLATTDAYGFANSPIWTLGSAAGVQTTEASVTNLPAVTFTAHALTLTAAQVSASSVPAGAAGQLASPAPAVLVQDRLGNPIANASVRFAVTAGNGSTSGNGVLSGANGIAIGDWRLGSPGVNTLTGTVIRGGVADPNVAGNPVTFTVNVVASSGIRVIVTIYSEPVSGVTATISGPSSASGTTDSNGTVLFAPLNPGTYSVTIVPPAFTYFDPTTQQVVVVNGQTTDVVFEGYGALAMAGAWRGAGRNW